MTKLVPPNYFNVQQTYDQVMVWLRKRNPFFHTRYNDGEWIAMFRLLPKTSRCDRHQYTHGIGIALKHTHDQIVENILSGNGFNILLGSNWQLANNYQLANCGAERFDQYIRSHPGLLEKAQWCSGDGWYTTQEEVNAGVDDLPDDKGLLALFDELRNGHDTVLVSNRRIVQACYCIGARSVVIPELDGWKEHQRILDDCLQTGSSRSVYVWCAGFPGKVLSWRIWQKRPNTSHFDLGHVLDGVFGVGIANWLRRTGTDPHQAHRRFLVDHIAPYVKGFIP